MSSGAVTARVGLPRVGDPESASGGCSDDRGARAPRAAAGDGQLDPSFGTDGQVFTDIEPGPGSEGASSVLLHADGRIFAAGMGGGNGFGLSRYTSSGAPDTTFGGDGEAFVKPISGPGAFNAAGAAARTPDGRYVVAGAAQTGGGFDSLVTRFTSTGQLDPSFGNDPPNPSGDGIVRRDLGGDDVVTSIAVDAQGRTVIAGRIGSFGAFDLFVARLTGDGSLDPGFGGTGVVTASPGASAQAYDLVLRPDGGILVGAAVDNQYRVFAYRDNGAPDTGYGGGDGVAPVPLSSSPGIFSPENAAIALQPDGKLVVAAIAASAGPNDVFGASRLLPDGSPDPAFAAGAATTVDVGANAYVADVALADDGRIVLVGYASTAGGEPSQIAVLALRPNGTRDTRFGSEGTALVGSEAGNENGFAVAIQPDRRIVLGADYSDGVVGDRLIVRLLGDTNPPDTRITKKPKRKVKLKKKAKFRFREVGDVNSRFECRLKQPQKKAKPFKACTSPFRKKVRREGKHAFKVRAIDPAGNIDATPAKKRFRGVPRRK